MNLSTLQVATRYQLAIRIDLYSLECSNIHDICFEPARLSHMPTNVICLLAATSLPICPTPAHFVPSSRHSRSPPGDDHPTGVISVPDRIQPLWDRPRPLLRHQNEQDRAPVLRTSIGPTYHLMHTSKSSTDCMAHNRISP